MYMETLPARSQKTRTTETTSMVWIELSSIWTIGTIVLIWSNHMENMETFSEVRIGITLILVHDRGEIRPRCHWSRKNTETFEPRMVSCVQTPSPLKNSAIGHNMDPVLNANPKMTHTSVSFPGSNLKQGIVRLYRVNERYTFCSIPSPSGFSSPSSFSSVVPWICAGVGVCWSCSSK